jgi:hypothetical protein
MNDTLLEIRERLLNVSMSTVFGQSIVAGVNTNLNAVIDMIRDQARDNRVLVADIVGETTLLLIDEL